MQVAQWTVLAVSCGLTLQICQIIALSCKVVVFIPLKLPKYFCKNYSFRYFSFVEPPCGKQDIVVTISVPLCAGVVHPCFRPSGFVQDITSTFLHGFQSNSQGWAANSTPGIYRWHLPVFTGLENTPQVANTGKYWQIDFFFCLKMFQKS